MHAMRENGTAKVTAQTLSGVPELAAFFTIGAVGLLIGAFVRVVIYLGRGRPKLSSVRTFRPAIVRLPTPVSGI
ncbi:hypothetical protein HYQ46_000409 [Verticillium longisporum]|nr:hypothetical protein HYQ46_000409 [Verticillium longisporum]